MEMVFIFLIDRCLDIFFVRMKFFYGVEDLRFIILIYGNVEMMEVFIKYLFIVIFEVIVLVNLNMGLSVVRRIECGVERW